MTEPPHRITPRVLDLVASIGESLGRLGVPHSASLSPQLRRNQKYRKLRHTGSSP